MKIRLLPAVYFPKHSENRMRREGDLVEARNFFFNRHPTNLRFLVSKRYLWMNDWIPETAKFVYELGCGPGFSKPFIRNPHLKLTDITLHDWADLQVDALKMPFSENSVDIFICSHMIHHLSQPKTFFKQAVQVLKPGGLILINEIETSFITRILLRFMRHEGWSYEIDVFSETDITNDPQDPWSANCAIPELLFSDTKRFIAEVPGLEILKNELCEFMIFPLSGGIIAKRKTLNLPYWMLKVIDSLDKLLISIAPNFFAMGRKVVLRKIS